MLLLSTLVALPVRAADSFGVWITNTSLSKNPYNRTVSFRFEPHAKGEVFTLDQVDRDGRSTTSSTILYLDGKEREFAGFGCSGMQSSRRLDTQTVEILRTCRSGESTRILRRLSSDTKELILEITEKRTEFRRLERRLVLEKQ